MRSGPKMIAVLRLGSCRDEDNAEFGRAVTAVRLLVEGQGDASAGPGGSSLGLPVL